MVRIRWNTVRSDYNESDGIKWPHMASEVRWDEKRLYEIRLHQMISDKTILGSDEIRSNEIEWYQIRSDEKKPHQMTSVKIWYNQMPSEENIWDEMWFDKVRLYEIR